MVRVRVVGVALDSSGQHVILLGPHDEAPAASRVLPIWIGEQEATSIFVAVEGAATPRPLAHDLMKSMLEALEASVERVEVTRIDGGTYYAEITLATSAGVRTIDARPSDAVALAARTGSPLFVADAVFDEAGLPAEVAGVVDEEARLEEFKRFLDDVDPEDFRE
ncbi:bifunctional nuclease family protein [Microbacterium sp. LRZ72]|uniref:bifunctional nuclease family protein n=1 Tax=Microbacterium sp. LRZ72 TaxID=2942481 RepID=UPI0029A4A6E1|nr:bifunctional nuclease family protein [Microbacterium sp. LRZ72]MDX2376726.1 bifunctional nuclease family protein [Microbacterium sp. LRZ72]